MPYRKWVKPEIQYLPRVVRDWSPEQLAVFQDIESGVGNTHVNAYAGAGKTSLLVESYYRIPRGESAVICTFSKENQEDLIPRLPPGASAKTFHAMGYAACKEAFHVGRPNKNKLPDLLKSLLGEDAESNGLRWQLQRAISLMKNYLISSPEELALMIDSHELETGPNRAQFIEFAIKVLNESRNDTSSVDFDDMIYFPSFYNLTLYKYDNVLIDEAQDLNKPQINIALGSVSKGGRVISVGDNFQAIFEWRGADHAIDQIIERCHSKTLPITTSYRCSKEVAKLAQTIVPDFKVAADAEEGSVEYIKPDDILDTVQPGDVILSRTNAPLIGWCLKLLKKGIHANIRGRDFGNTLSFLMSKSKAKTVDELVVYLEEYKAAEDERLKKAHRSHMIVDGKVECLLELCEGAITLKNVQDNIDNLFHDGVDENKVILSTAHRFKGLERKRAFILMDTFKESDNREEKNIRYVSFTRAKTSLFLVVK